MKRNINELKDGEGIGITLGDYNKLSLTEKKNLYKLLMAELGERR